jgi:hypothetical protein
MMRRHPKKLVDGYDVELWLGPDGREVEHTPKGQKWHDTPLLEVEETAMDYPKYDRRELQRTVDLKAKLLAVLDQAEGYRRPWDRGERESDEHIVELYVRIAAGLETTLDG